VGTLYNIKMGSIKTCPIPPEVGVFVPPVTPRLPVSGKLVHPGGVIDPTTLPALKKLPSIHPQVVHLLKITPLGYKPLAIANVNVQPYGGGDGHVQLVTDGQAAYQSAVAYLVTTNEAYAKQVVTILDAWATTCVSFEGPNAPLEAAWVTAAMARAAELLKYTWSGWEHSGVEKRYLAWVDAIVLTHLVKPLGWDDRNNWGLSICEARLILSILREGTVTPTYDWSKEFMWSQYQYQRIHAGYVMNTGQTGEFTRDYFHCAFGIGSLIQIPEMMWHQGIDLYNNRDSLMQKCMEFTAYPLLGKDPPNAVGCTKDVWFVPGGWFIAYKHYHGRKGLPMPNTQAVLTKYPIDGFTFHWGLGSLTHAV
jgi:hypothetical protein